MKRTQEREQAFILIFEKIFRENDSIEHILEDALSAEAYIENEYSKKVFIGVFENIELIDNLIKENLKGWSIDRISKVALSIMRLCVYEMKFLEDIPVGVSINEAVELCKKFATSDDSNYINGVLGSISKEL